MQTNVFHQQKLITLRMNINFILNKGKSQQSGPFSIFRFRLREKLVLIRHKTRRSPNGTAKLQKGPGIAIPPAAYCIVIATRGAYQGFLVLVQAITSPLRDTMLSTFLEFFNCDRVDTCLVFPSSLHPGCRPCILLFSFLYILRHDRQTFFPPSFSTTTKTGLLPLLVSALLHILISAGEIRDIRSVTGAHSTVMRDPRQ